jgi:Ca2+-binding RTX toxin-like protein
VFGSGAGFPASFSLSALNGSNGFRLTGVAAGDNSGFSVSGAGDVNGDGFGDLIVGAPGASPHGTASGSSYVVFGKAAAFAASVSLATLNGRNGFRLDGEAASDRSGSAVAGIGDFNGDGFDDVGVGAPYANSSAGSAYVFFGHGPTAAVTRIGSAANQYISGGAFADTLKGGSGDDALEGRGGADVLIGGFGQDAASYAHAPAAVVASLANPVINTGDAAGDSYSGIENLIGSRFGDTLIGNNLANRTTGGPGADVLTGGGGNDVFVYNDVSDSPVGAPDRITDFDAGGPTTFVDRIDLSAIDAKTGPGNQAFVFIGTTPFTGVKGQLRVEQVGTTAAITGDVNGDGKADFEIDLLNFTNLQNLTSIDFIR